MLVLPLSCSHHSRALLSPTGLLFRGLPLTDIAAVGSPLSASSHTVLTNSLSASSCSCSLHSLLLILVYISGERVELWRAGRDSLGVSVRNLLLAVHLTQHTLWQCSGRLHQLCAGPFCTSCVVLMNSFLF